ncbi:type II secretion system protein [Candidatus Nomurabacteria bacterium]|nr:type II secretion system protein [Candidatus Nomurabacteria bacterium]
MKNKIKNFFKNIDKDKLGFTLVEILIVVAVVGILSVISYVGVSDIRKSIRDNRRRADLQTLARALEAFKSDYGQYLPQNFYSTSNYNTADGWSAEADETMMPILKEGGDITVVYQGEGEPVVRNKTIEGGYLAEYIKDPINDTSDWDDSYAYIYWGAAFAQTFDLNSFLWDPFINFPMACPEPSVDTCGTAGGTNTETWGDCCNTGCWDQYCIFNANGPGDADDTLTWVVNNNTNFGRYCYGSDSSRNMALLGTRLEKESKPEERFENLFAFCPTADEDHPDHDRFKYLKGYFPRAKACYDGTGADPYNCDSDGWSFWALNNYNYFIPLTGEYNLN